ncbi:MAG: NADP-binding protein [Clostridiales bacterium]|nr:NADP-binding protein [Clostridiales bacterium]
MRNVRVALWGFGAMGKGMAKLLLSRIGVEIVGVCDRYPTIVGKSIYELLEVDRAGRPDLLIVDDIDKALQNTPVDCCIVATDSFVKDVFPKIKQVVKQGVNVLTIAEEMSYPAAQEPELAAEMDRLAKAHKVSILGTGINPGLMMDLLAVCLSGAMTQVSHVRCERVNSLSPFGETVMHEQGIGISVEQFDQGVKDGSLAGHVGFHESAAMIAGALGMSYDSLKQQMLPIITDVDRKSPHGFAAKGHIAGVNMTAQAMDGDREIISLIHPQQIEPEQVGVDTGDYITLTGTPPIHMAVKPEVNGGLGTIAMACNCLPFVVAARPGLLTMLDLPVPRCVMGDYREIAFPEGRNE